jgi:hypothetical protein
MRVDANLVTDDDALDTLKEAADAGGAVVARFNPKTRVRAGEQVDVTFDPSRLYFFDPESHLAIGPRETSGVTT